MKAEIISIGDEMTTGQRLDTNSRWLSQQLGDLGVSTLRHTTVTDDLDVNTEVFSSAAQRADIIISTGGLGPTLDDLTREAIALAFDAPLELDAASLAHIENMFAQRKRPMPERNRVQAMMPRGSRVIANPHGTAPGIDLSVPRTGKTSSRIFALPGVPAEMVEMWNGSVRGSIVDMLGPNRQQLMFHTIKMFGIGESDVEVELPDLMRRDRYPRVGITVSRATISLRIAAQASSPEEFAELIAPTIAEIEAAMGVLIFGTGDDELEHAVLRQLHARNAKLAVLEIGPSALVANWLLSAKSALQSDLVTVLSSPSQAAAAELFQKLTALNQPADSLPTVRELANCVRRTFDADIGLAFGTYASSEQLRQRKPAADVNVAIAGDGLPDDVRTRTIIGHPDILNDRVAKTALDTLRLTLLKAEL